MNETLNVIKNRRSIRRYKPQQIADHELQEIMKAAIYAPSAMNQQKWHFSVIQNKDVLDKMESILKENLSNSGIDFFEKNAANPDFRTFYNAPTVVLVSGEENNRTIQLDCGLASENIALAAASLNIGSCIITSSGFLFASEKGNAMRVELGIPDGYKHICTIALGYKDGENPEAPPKSEEVISYIK